MMRTLILAALLGLLPLVSLAQRDEVVLDYGESEIVIDPADGPVQCIPTTVSGIVVVHTGEGETGWEVVDAVFEEDVTGTDFSLIRTRDGCRMAPERADG